MCRFYYVPNLSCDWPFFNTCSYRNFPIVAVLEREEKEDSLFRIVMCFHIVVFSFEQHAISRGTIYSVEENLDVSNFLINVLQCYVKNYIPEVQQ
jgi:hypothetical protein